MDPSCLAMGNFLGNDLGNGHHHGSLLGLCDAQFWGVLELGSGRKCGVCALVDLGGFHPHDDYVQEKRYGVEDFHRAGDHELHPSTLCHVLGSIRGIR